jgi:monovalent cation/hydrogen antiporter
MTVPSTHLRIIECTVTVIQDIVRPLRAAQRERLKHVEQRSDGDASHKKLMQRGDEIEYLLIAVERDLIKDLYRRGELKDEARRRIERELDLRDAHLTSVRAEDVNEDLPDD